MKLTFDSIVRVATTIEYLEYLELSGRFRLMREVLEFSGNFEKNFVGQGSIEYRVFITGENKSVSVSIISP